MEENGESEGSRKLRWGRAPGCAALREEGGPEVLNEPFQTPLPMQGGKSSEAAARGHRPILPVQQDRTFNKPSPLWKRVGAPVGSREAEVAPAAALATAAAAAAAPALLGETVPLRQGRTRLELKEAPARRRRRALPGCSVKALRQKKTPAIYRKKKL